MKRLVLAAVFITVALSAKVGSKTDSRKKDPNTRGANDDFLAAVSSHFGGGGGGSNSHGSSQGSSTSHIDFNSQSQGSIDTFGSHGSNFGGSQSHRPSGGSQSHRPSGGSQSHRPFGGSQSHRPGGGSQSHRPFGGSQSHRPGSGSQSHRPFGGSQSHRPGSGSQSHRPGGGFSGSNHGSFHGSNQGNFQGGSGFNQGSGFHPGSRPNRPHSNRPNRPHSSRPSSFGQTGQSPVVGETDPHDGGCTYVNLDDKGQPYCADGQSSVVREPEDHPERGDCPTIRPSCTDTQRLHFLKCAHDGDCTTGRCCFDKCLKRHTCKKTVKHDRSDNYSGFGNSQAGFPGSNPGHNIHGGNFNYRG